MAKWKCEICGNEFDNFHAQGFDNKIYCPLCYFKKENQELKKQLEELKSTNKVLSEKLTKDKILKQDCLTTCCGIPIGDIPKLINQQKEFINYLENNWEKTQDIWYIKILQKYKSIIGVSDETN